MRWHAQRLRCSQAIVVRGYKRGSYRAQSQYQALMLVLRLRGEAEIQGFLASEKLSRKDFARLRQVGRRLGISLVSSRRRGRPTDFSLGRP